MSLAPGLALLLSFCLFHLTGCIIQTSRGPDAWPSQPYFGGPQAAVAETEIRSSFYRISGDILWSSPKGQDINAKPIRGTRIADTLMAYLQDTWLEFDAVDSSTVEGQQIYNASDQNPLSIRYPRSVFRQTSVICSIDPIIMIIVSTPVGTVYGGQSLSGYSANILAPNLVAPDDAFIVGLPGGILYGNRLPRSEKLWWASPDLNVKLEPLAFNIQGEARIELPWGTLRIVRSGEGYVVLADSSEE